MTIAENETVFLVDESGKRAWLRVESKMLRVSSLGTLDGSRLIGLEDGSRVNIAGRDYTIFRPGILDLMGSLDRGAQIITPKDASTIIMNCDVHSGSIVIEVGAGSGGLTTALLGSVAPLGKVHTVEYREENAQRALKNIRRTGLDQYWSFTLGDAKDVDIGDVLADSLIMDMPDPWLALDNLVPHLRNGGRLCAYVPNTNQVESTVNALRGRGFADVFALENLQRGIEVHPGGVRPAFEMLGHTGYLIFARKRASS